MGEKEREARAVPRWTHEADMARMERANKRLWIALLLTIVLLVASNAAWALYESQFEETTVTQEVDTGDGPAFVAGVGDVNCGESATNSEDANP